MSSRWRPVWAVAIAVVLIWAGAIAGYSIAQRSRMTAEKVNAYASKIDLSKLSAADRAKAIQTLAEKLNSLSLEERQKARLDRTAWRWFEQMTEEEKGGFIEATMPTGFKNMITAFEELPEERRRRVIDDSLKRLRETQTRIQSSDRNFRRDTNAPVLSPELEKKLQTIGLNTFYSQSSAQTKAELAPVLEELQRTMQTGRHLRRR